MWHTCMSFENDLSILVDDRHTCVNATLSGSTLPEMTSFIVAEKLYFSHCGTVAQHVWRCCVALVVNSYNADHDKYREGSMTL